MLLMCTSCSEHKEYQVKDYLYDLSEISGISNSSNQEEVLQALDDWGICKSEDNRYLRKELDYSYLGMTLCRLMEFEEESLEYLIENGWLERRVEEKEKVDRDTALAYIRKAVDQINSPEFEDEYIATFNEDIRELNRYVCKDGNLYTEQSLSEGDVIYLENDGYYVRVDDVKDGFYIVEEAQMNEIYEDLKIAGSYDVDLSKAIDHSYGMVSEEVNYLSSGLSLMAYQPEKLRKSFKQDDFTIAYSISSSAVSVRISKESGHNATAFFDFTISNIRPSYEYNYEDGKLRNAFFKVDYDTVDELGVSSGKYLRYIAEFEDLDNSSFLNKMKSVIKPDIDEIDATIKICEIKTPIPNIPSAYLNIDLVARIYASGKAEILLTNSHSLGFEVKNSRLRVIANTDRDVDGIIQANSKAVMGINFNIEAGKLRLMDIEADAGLSALVKTTLHLYDSDGSLKKQESDLPYSAVNELSSASPDIKVCGDLSFNYVLDVDFNTSRTVLYKLGLNTTRTVLGKKDQVFHNMTHIEEGAFVPYCTRKSRFKKTGDSLTFTTDRISLPKYSVVIRKGESYSVVPLAIPKGYLMSDLCLRSNDQGVASVSGLEISGVSMGVTKVEVVTNDGRYSAEINILVGE